MMTVEEVRQILNRPNVDEKGLVRVRNTLITEDEMEEGTDGYLDVEEVLVAGDTVYLLLTED